MTFAPSIPIPIALLQKDSTDFTEASSFLSLENLMRQQALSPEHEFLTAPPLNHPNSDSSFTFLGRVLLSFCYQAQVSFRAIADSLK